MNKANTLSENNIFVSQTRSRIAYNLCLLGSLKERYGSNIEWSIRCFQESKSLVSDLQKANILINDYASACSAEIQKVLLKELIRDKKQYDPATSKIDILYELIKLTEGCDSRNDIMKTFIAFAKQKIKRDNKNKNIANNLNEIIGIYATQNPGVKEPILNIPIFGKPKMEF